MASPSYLCVCATCVLVCLILLSPITCYAQYFFIFGDSLFDGGNAKILNSNQYNPSDYPPYGTTFFNHTTGRYSDGRVIPDFIATYLNLPFMPPSLNTEATANFSHGANFATAGAGVTKSETEGAVLDFEDQVEDFKWWVGNWSLKIDTNQLQHIVANAVYLVAMGGNDYFRVISNGLAGNLTVPEQQPYVDIVIGNLTERIRDLYESGARKFIFQNLAPVGCLPMWKQTYNITDGGCAGKPLTFGHLHNAQLPNALRNLSTQLPGFVWTIFDYFTAVGNRINNPAKYGYKYGDIACCGSGTHRSDSCGSQSGDYEVCFNKSEHVFFDGGHHTEFTNYQLAELIWNGGENAISPLTAKQMFELEYITNSHPFEIRQLQANK